MTNPFEVGSLIGGRYKVTGMVLSTAEGDDVLTGLDQVLNRRVSILIASKKNASQAAQSGRELATGERSSHVQVLDMVISDGRPALITNTAKANDLLDLLVSQDKPFVEPFFTESLGSEIFGQRREATPEDDPEWDENYYELRENKPIFDLSSVSEKARAKAAERAVARDAAAVEREKAAREKAEQERADKLAEKERQRRAAERDRALVKEQEARAASAVAHPVQEPVEESDATQAVAVTPQPAAQPRPEQRKPAVRPLGPADDADDAPVSAPRPSNTARNMALGAAAGGTGAALSAPRASAEDHDNLPSESYDSDDESWDEDDVLVGSTAVEEEDADPKGRMISRALVGLLLAAMLIGAVVLAVTQLGSLFSNGQATASRGATSSASAPAATSATPSEAAVTPEIIGVSRHVPNNPTLDSASDVNLGRIIDGNPQSAWGSLVYTNPQFGNLASSFALVFELKEPAKVSKLTLSQQYGSGGAFQVLVNDSPTLEGATAAGQGSFSSQDVVVNVDSDKKSKYVILNVTQLPTLSGVQVIYPYGMVISEVKVQ